jgi:hypothetical protein
MCIPLQHAYPATSIFRIVLYWNQVAFQDHVVLDNSAAFVNLIWPLLMLSFGPTWPLFRLPLQTSLLDPLP